MSRIDDRCVSADGFRAQVQEALDRGEPRVARRLCTERLRLVADDAMAARFLAVAHLNCDERERAIEAAERACTIAPGDPQNWCEIGRIYGLLGRIEAAVACLVKAVEIDPRHADSWHNLGLALHRAHNEEQAFVALRNALLVDPKRAETYLALGNLLIGSGQLDEAIECFERATEHDPALAAARLRLAQQHSARGQTERAASLFRQAVGLDPNHVDGWFGLGRTLEDLGDAESALACYRRVLSQQASHARALGHFLSLIKGAAEQEILASAEQIICTTAPAEVVAAVGYGLAKYHDRRHAFAEAARAGLIANAARRSQAGVLDRKLLATRVDHLITICTRDFFDARRRFGVGTDQPVFIVGLPRSGTTLTEQIISTHPRMHGAGELPTLSRAATAFSGEKFAEPWHATELLDEQSSRHWAGQYLRALRDGVPRGCLRICDKQPLNFFHLGFAALLFPNARVVHCRRNSRDTALSIWMENFNPDQHYATDFSDLAFFITEYRRLMAHWREVLPLRILDLDYEATVTNLEAQARRLVAFLGAEWDASCLEFHKSSRAIQTPSRWQVREPIYSRSIGRWKHYSQHLPGFEAAFRDLN